MIIAISITLILGMLMLANLDQLNRLFRLQLADIKLNNALWKNFIRVLPYLCCCALIVDIMIALAISTSIFAVVTACMIMIYVVILLFWFWFAKELLTLVYKLTGKYFIRGTTMRFITIWLQRQHIMLVDEIKWLSSAVKIKLQNRT